VGLLVEESLRTEHPLECRKSVGGRVSHISRRRTRSAKNCRAEPSRADPVQTFCTSLKRPETGRSRRRLGARPSLSWRTRRPRRQPVGWRAGADRAAATTGLQVVGVGGVWPAAADHGGLGNAARGTRRAAGRVTAVERRGWRRAACRAAPPSSRALRVASDGPAGRP
jgi:hypothetical protein